MRSARARRDLLRGVLLLSRRPKLKLTAGKRLLRYAVSNTGILRTLLDGGRRWHADLESRRHAMLIVRHVQQTHGNRQKHGLDPLVVQYRGLVIRGADLRGVLAALLAVDLTLGG